MEVADLMDQYYTDIFGDSAEDLERHYLADGWQTLASMHSTKSFFSTIQWVSSGKEIARAKFVGGALGHAVSHHRTMCNDRIWRTCCKALNALSQVQAEHGIDYKSPVMMSADRNDFLSTTPQFNHAVGRAMELASKQAKLPQAIFFEAYAKALRKGTVDEHARGTGQTSRSNAYQIVSAFGPMISIKCHSVHDVHRFLVKMMGKSMAGEVKRTEALCKKIGLKFRAPGRPKA